MSSELVGPKEEKPELEEKKSVDMEGCCTCENTKVQQVQSEHERLKAIAFENFLHNNVYIKRCVIIYNILYSLHPYTTYFHI